MSRGLTNKRRYSHSHRRKLCHVALPIRGGIYTHTVERDVTWPYQFRAGIHTYTVERDDTWPYQFKAGIHTYTVERDVTWPYQSEMVLTLTP
jgi:hypothetical protein